MKYKIIKVFPSLTKEWKVGEIISPNEFRATCEIAPNWPEYFEKIEELLFTTEDKVDMYEDNEYWYVTYTWQCHGANTSGYNKNWMGNKTFSTKEAAKNYVLMNKPCLSLNDIAQFCLHVYVPSSPGHTYGYTKIDSTKLEQLVKSKI